MERIFLLSAIALGLYIYGLNGSDEGFKPKQKKLKNALATVRSPVLASVINRSFHWAFWLSGMSGVFEAANWSSIPTKSGSIQLGSTLVERIFLLSAIAL